MYAKFSSSDVIPKESFRPLDLVGKPALVWLDRINPSLPEDMAILDTWRDHLRQQGLAYAVVVMPGGYWRMYKRPGLGLIVGGES